MKYNKQLIIFIILFSVNNFYGQSLDDYIQLAIKNNSSIKAKQYNEQLAEEKVQSVNTFANTQFKMGVYALQPETRVGNQSFKIGVAQQFPWFGTNKAKKEWQISKVKLANNNTRLSQKKIVYQVKQSYYDIYAQKAIRKILEENKKILTTYENIARGALQNNKSTMTDILMIQLKKNELDSKIQQIDNVILTLNYNFNLLLEQDINTQISVPESIELSKNITIKSVDEHPSLQNNKEMLNVLEKERFFIKKSSKPKFSIGIDYISVLERPNFIDNNNGKDIIMPQISLSIPVFNSFFKSKLKQIDIQKAAVNSINIIQKNTLQSALNNAKKQYRNALIEINFHRKNTSTTDTAIRLTLKSYENNKIDFEKVLTLQLEKIKYQINIIKATKKALIAKAKIAYLTA